MTLLNSFFIINIVNSILSLALGIFIYIKGINKILNKIWSLFCLSVSLWSLGLGMMCISQNIDIAIFWFKYIYSLGLIFLPITFMHFCLILVDYNKKRKLLIFISYILGAILEVITVIGLLGSAQQLKPFKYYTKPGLLYPLFFIGFIFFTGYAFYILIKGIRSSDKKNKKKLTFFMISAIVGYFAGSTAFFPVYKIPIFPYGIYIFSLYILIISYAIFHHHLMDINIVIKQGTIYAFMIALVTAVYLGTIFLFGNILSSVVGYNLSFTRFIAILIIAITFLPIRNKIEKFIDKIFFRKRIEFFQSIHDFSQNLITIQDLRLLMDTITNDISSLLNVDKICLFFYNKKERNYRIKSVRGFGDYNNTMRETILSSESALACWLKNNKVTEIRSKLIKDDEYNLYEPVAKQMEEFNAELAIPLFFNKKLIGLLTLDKKKNQDIYSKEELDLLESFANQASISLSNALAYANLKKFYLGTVDAFIKAIEAKDIYTQGHSYRVVDIATKIAIEHGESRKQIDLLKYAGVLHDIGKIGIDNRILNKPGGLNDIEYNEIKKHPIIGKDIVSSIEFLEDASDIILHHHERWDGNGYPDRLKEEGIPLLSRIIFIADAYDAMISSRSYRDAMEQKKAVAEIKRSAGKQFDPELVKCFLSIYKKKEI